MQVLEHTTASERTQQSLTRLGAAKPLHNGEKLLLNSLRIKKYSLPKSDGTLEPFQGWRRCHTVWRLAARHVRNGSDPFQGPFVAAVPPVQSA
jgi:hypothetical protein